MMLGRGLPEPVANLYREARECVHLAAYTASALATRTVLMNVAAIHGATAGQSFGFYLDYLNQQGFVPTRATAWLDQVRRAGDVPSSEIPSVTESDAQELIAFAGMVLKAAFA